MNIFVSNLNYSTTDDDLGQMFADFGEVTSAKVITDRMSGRSKGFGFVEMSDDEQGQKAIDELNGKEISGRTINVAVAKPRTERSDGGRRGNRY